ncbi:MAG TPA: DUF3105 domain-containing protein [Candidatus Saccharimonadales bacterium]|nr:DUF3105 domain-containing protein [Candidatus Saccharimonadales bacterium]
MSRKRSGRDQRAKNARAAEARGGGERPNSRGGRGRSRRGRPVPWIAIGIVVAAVVAGVLVFRSLDIGAPGERIATSGVGQHLPDGQPITYDSTPPVGGPHWPGPAAWGANGTTIPDARAVHNLEHGGIVVSYNAIPAEDLGRLKALPGTLSRDRFNEVKLVIHPYDRIPAGTIVLTAWGWRQALPAYDEAKIRAFYDAHQNRCCESVP